MSVDDPEKATTAPIDVLHVDDDRSFLDLTRSFLEAELELVEVTTVATPEEVVPKLAAESFHCVVSDYDMPGMDGLELLSEVREQFPDLPFVLYTGKGSEEIASDAISAGVNDYLQKQSGIDHYELLANKIETAVARQRAERELRTTKEQYQRLVEQNVVGIYLIQGGEFQFVNEKLAAIHGYDRETVVDMSPLELIAESDRDRVRLNLQERLSGDRDERNYRAVGKHRDGSTLDLELHGGRVSYEGRPAVMGVVVNWSERDEEG